MAGVSGQGTTLNLPNYVGELFAVTPTDTPFLSSIGGLTGGETTTSTTFQWNGYDLRDADENRQRLEGADAPTAEERTRFNVKNVVEIHQEALEVSYTKQAATGQFNATGAGHPGNAGISGMNAVGNEFDWQVQRHLEQIARDVEKTFLVGVYSDPATNATARKTGGIISSTVTNVSTQGTAVGTAVIEADDEVFTLAAHGLVVGNAVVFSTLTGGAVGVLKTHTLYYVKTVPGVNTFTVALKPGGATVAFATDGGAVVTKATPLTEGIVTDLLQDVWEQGGIQRGETATLMSNGTLKRGLTELYITRKNYQEQTRTVGGVSVLTITTDFGELNVMLNRHMPSSVLQVVSLEECAPVFLNVPGKGFLFQEPLAKVGSADRAQIYGEVGLKYGNERKHGKVLNVTAPAPLA
jgi:Family of unknown function (DUF5309)